MFLLRLIWAVVHALLAGASPILSLLLHGDSNPYCMDKEFGGKQAPNLWRLNAWGDFQDPADATVVTVRPESKQTPFAAETLLEHNVPADECE